MAKFSKYVGLDTHKETITVSVADAGGDQETAQAIKPGG